MKVLKVNLFRRVLTKQKSEVLELKISKGLSVEEIAEALEETVETIEKLMKEL